MQNDEKKVNANAAQDYAASPDRDKDAHQKRHGEVSAAGASATVSDTFSGALNNGRVPYKPARTAAQEIVPGRTAELDQAAVADRKTRFNHLAGANQADGVVATLHITQANASLQHIQQTSQRINTAAAQARQAHQPARPTVEAKETTVALAADAKLVGADMATFGKLSTHQRDEEAKSQLSADDIKALGDSTNPQAARDLANHLKDLSLQALDLSVHKMPTEVKQTSYTTTQPGGAPVIGMAIPNGGGLQIVKTKTYETTQHGSDAKIKFKEFEFKDGPNYHQGEPQADYKLKYYAERQGEGDLPLHKIFVFEDAATGNRIKYAEDYALRPNAPGGPLVAQFEKAVYEQWNANLLFQRIDPAAPVAPGVVAHADNERVTAPAAPFVLVKRQEITKARPVDVVDAAAAAALDPVVARTEQFHFFETTRVLPGALVVADPVPALPATPEPTAQQQATLEAVAGRISANPEDYKADTRLSREEIIAAAAQTAHTYRLDGRRAHANTYQTHLRNFQAIAGSLADAEIWNSFTAEQKVELNALFAADRGFEADNITLHNPPPRAAAAPAVAPALAVIDPAATITALTAQVRTLEQSFAATAPAQIAQRPANQAAVTAQARTARRQLAYFARALDPTVQANRNLAKTNPALARKQQNLYQAITRTLAATKHENAFTYHTAPVDPAALADAQIVQAFEVQKSAAIQEFRDTTAGALNAHPEYAHISDIYIELKAATAELKQAHVTGLTDRNAGLADDKQRKAPQLAVSELGLLMRQMQKAHIDLAALDPDDDKEAHKKQQDKITQLDGQLKTAAEAAVAQMESFVADLPAAQQPLVSEHLTRARGNIAREEDRLTTQSQQQRATDIRDQLLKTFPGIDKTKIQVIDPNELSTGKRIAHKMGNKFSIGPDGSLTIFFGGAPANAIAISFTDDEGQSVKLHVSGNSLYMDDASPASIRAAYHLHLTQQNVGDEVVEKWQAASLAADRVVALTDAKATTEADAAALTALNPAPGGVVVIPQAVIDALTAVHGVSDCITAQQAEQDTQQGPTLAAANATIAALQEARTQVDQALNTRAAEVPADPGAAVIRQNAITALQQARNNIEKNITALQAVKHLVGDAAKVQPLHRVGQPLYNYGRFIQENQDNANAALGKVKVDLQRKYKELHPRPDQVALRNWRVEHDLSLVTMGGSATVTANPENGNVVIRMQETWAEAFRRITPGATEIPPPDDRSPDVFFDAMLRALEDNPGRAIFFQKDYQGNAAFAAGRDRLDSYLMAKAKCELEHDPRFKAQLDELKQQLEAGAFADDKAYNAARAAIRGGQPPISIHAAAREMVDAQLSRIHAHAPHYELTEIHDRAGNPTGNYQLKIVYSGQTNELEMKNQCQEAIVAAQIKADTEYQARVEAAGGNAAVIAVIPPPRIDITFENRAGGVAKGIRESVHNWRNPGTIAPEDKMKAAVFTACRGVLAEQAATRQEAEDAGGQPDVVPVMNLGLYPAQEHYTVVEGVDAASGRPTVEIQLQVHAGMSARTVERAVEQAMLNAATIRNAQGQPAEIKIALAPPPPANPPRPHQTYNRNLARLRDSGELGRIRDAVNAKVTSATANKGAWGLPADCRLEATGRLTPPAAPAAAPQPAPHQHLAAPGQN